MIVEIKVPPLGESVNEVKVARIIAPSGSFVPVDGELIELETDKLNQVLYASVSGIVTIKTQIGETLKIGDVVATIEEKSPESIPKVQKQKQEAVATPPAGGAIPADLRARKGR